MPNFLEKYKHIDVSIQLIERIQDTNNRMGSFWKDPSKSPSAVVDEVINRAKSEIKKGTQVKVADFAHEVKKASHYKNEEMALARMEKVFSQALLTHAKEELSKRSSYAIERYRQKPNLASNNSEGRAQKLLDELKPQGDQKGFSR